MMSSITYCATQENEEIAIQDWKPSGAQGRNRTTDTAIFSRMLYQLSYLGMSRAEAGSAGL
jgi:hypothetical protein